MTEPTADLIDRITPYIHTGEELASIPATHGHLWTFIGDNQFVPVVPGDGRALCSWLLPPHSSWQIGHHGNSSGVTIGELERFLGIPGTGVRE